MFVSTILFVFDVFIFCNYDYAEKKKKCVGFGRKYLKWWDVLLLFNTSCGDGDVSGHLQQPISSELSVQSMLWSHFLCFPMHWPLKQENWSGGHRTGRQTLNHHRYFSLSSFLIHIQVNKRIWSDSVSADNQYLKGLGSGPKFSASRWNPLSSLTSAGELPVSPSHLFSSEWSWQLISPLQRRLRSMHCRLSHWNSDSEQTGQFSSSLLSSHSG